MQNAGLDERTIIATIRANGTTADTSPQGLVSLKQANVSDAIIGVLVTAKSESNLTVAAGRLKIQDGTSVRLNVMETISSTAAHPNDPVRLEVAEDVKVSAIVVIPRGAAAVGHVVVAEKAGKFGKGGRLELSLDYVTAPDGTNVRLKSSSGEQGGKQSTAALMLGLSGAFVKGKNVEVAKGSILNSFVDGDREVGAVAQAK